MALVAVDPAPAKTEVELALQRLHEAVVGHQVAGVAQWRSLCSTKVKWNQPAISELALHFIKNLPQDALLMLLSGSLKPGPLVELPSSTSVTARDLLTAAPWVRPFQMRFPEAVPSGYLIADVLVAADKILGGKLLRNDIKTGR